VADGAAAARELAQAIERLLDAQLRGRVGELIAKAREASLTAQEKQELQALTTTQNKQGPA
jgi:hypothetical protein